MSEPLRVLVVEDSVDDAELILHELKSGGYELFASRVENAVAMKEALDNGQWDVVLGDYSMPHFSGLNALKLLQAKGRDIPFIVVSGKIGEETAVAMMKAGAHDYVMKDNLKRLASAVKRELQEAGSRREHRQAEAALKESEERYRSVVENTGDLIQSINPNGHFLFVNKAWLNTLEYSAEDLPGLTLFDIIHPESLSHCREMFERVMHGEKGLNIEATFVTKSGKKVFVNGSASPRYMDGQVVATQDIFHDITERKRAEEALKESEAKYSTIVEEGNDGITIIQNSLLEFVNLRIAKMAGFSREEILGKPFIDFIAPADRKQVIDRYQNRLRGENVPSNYEINIIAKNGKLIPVEINPNRIIYKRHAVVMAIVRDITERKKMEESLRRAAQEWRTTFDSISDMVSIQDRDYKIIRVNRTFANSFKKEPQELIGKTCYEVVHGMGEPISGCPHLEVLKTKKPVTVEINNAKDDTYSEIAISPIFNADGEVVATVQIIRNITDRKHAEEEVRKQYAILKSIIESPQTPIFSVDRNYRYTSFNSTHAAIMKALYGADIEIGKNLLDYHSVARDREQAKQNIDRVLNGEIVRIESWAGPEGPARSYFEISHSPVEDDKGNITGASVFARDLTERKQMEEALRASEEKFRALFENAPVGIAVTYPDGSSIIRNAFNQKMHGYDSKEEFMKLKSDELYYHIDDRKHWIELLEKGPVKDFEVQHKRKDGSIFWVSLTAIQQTNVSGDKQFILITQDITERKQMEEALKASEEKYRTMVENLPVGIAISTFDGRPVERNRASMEMHGYTSFEEFNKISPISLYPDLKDRERFLEALQKGIVRNFEIKHKRKDGSTFWISMTAIPQTGENGEKQLLVVSQDIDERKRAEEGLQQNYETETVLNQLLTLSLENIPIDELLQRSLSLIISVPSFSLESKGCIFLTDSQSDVLNMVAQIGLVKPLLEKCKQVPFGKCICGLAASSQKIEFVNCIDGRHEIQYDGIIPHGHYAIPILLNSRTIGVINTYVKEGHTKNIKEEQFLTSVANVLAGIIIRKQVVEALRASEEKLRNLVENLPVGIGVSMIDGRSLQRNRALMEMYGFTDRREFDNSSTPGRYYDIKDRARFVELAEKGPVKGFEVRLKRRDETVFWASMNAIKQTTLSGEKQFLTVIQDIDDKKKVEAENTLKAMLLDSAADMIYVQDLTGKLIYANDATCKSHGFSKDELATMNIRDLLPPEYIDIVAERTNKVLEKGELRFETVHSCKDGSNISLEVYNRLIKIGDGQAIISVGRDISERKQMEEQLMIADRLASIGELASGVAHEVNNPLTSVIGFSELLLERPLPDDIKEDLTTIRNEAQRAAGVVRNLLTFARKQAPSRQPVNLNDIVKKVLELRAYEENINNIVVIPRLAPDLAPVMADASQLQQVFFNIMTNAEYFMIESHHKGTLTITTENIGQFVRASFRDDGPGMSAENLAHLFTPFFTTKPVGKGTGLGLSICHGIMASHDGKIYAESTPGKGATFIVELPVSDTDSN